MHLFWIFAHCDCWLILQSGLIISFSRTFARLMSTKRDFIKGVLCVWIHRSLRISFWEKLTWKEEINWLLDFTKPDTICTLCKHGLFHIPICSYKWNYYFLLRKGFADNFFVRVFFIQKGGGPGYYKRGWMHLIYDFFGIGTFQPILMKIFFKWYC